MTKYVDLSNLHAAHGRRTVDVLSDEYYKFKNNYWLGNKTLEIGAIMKGKPAIAYQKYIVNGFYDWLNRFAFGRGWSLICAIKLQPMVY